MMAGFRVLQTGLVAKHERPLVVRLQGFDMTLDLREMHDVRMYLGIRSHGFYEPETSTLLTTLLQPGDTFVDVGSNNGYFAMLSASLVGPKGFVLAIEPNPASFQRLERNIELNNFGSRIRALPVAAGAKATHGTLHVAQFEDGWASLIDSPDSKSTVSVPVRSLDELIPPTPSLIVKIDVEGSEYSVLSGMERVIRKSSSLAVIIEWNRKFATRDLWDLLTSYFQVRGISSGPNGF